LNVHLNQVDPSLIFLMGIDPSLISLRLREGMKATQDSIRRLPAAGEH
jgi:hypothetical protein